MILCKLKYQQQKQLLRKRECKFKRTLGCESFTQVAGEAYVCSKCTDGWMYDFTNKKCVEGKDICTTNDNTNGECTYCIDLYRKGSTKCLDCSTENQYCTVIDATADDCKKCTTCAPGTKKNAAGICELIDEFCALEITGEKCTQCVSGYYVGTTKCEKGNLDKCEIYDTAAKCTRCFEKYILNKDVCVEDANCESISAVNLCLKCKAGYKLVDGLCKACTAKNCKTCEADLAKCDTCGTDFSVLTDPDCVACAPENCVYCNTGKSDECASCKEGYKLNTATKKCDKCTASNCAKCEGEGGLGVCTECLAAFPIFKTPHCEACTAANCADCADADGTKCDICVPGYVAVEGVCEKCTDTNCIYCSPKETCSACKDGYRVNEAKCQACSDTNCLTCTAAVGVCTKCKTGYTVAGEKCYPIIDHCDKYTAEGQCETCDSLSTLNAGKCDVHHCSATPYGKENECEGCVNGYYLNDKYKCVACDSKCVDNEEDNVKGENYYGCVYAAAECIDINLMRAEDQGCRFYNKEHVCIECTAAYNLVDGQCNFKYEECVSMTVTGKCTLCHDATELEYWPGDDFVCVDASGAFGIAILAVFAIFMMF